MWDKLGFITAIFGTVIGGIVLCWVVAAVMYLAIFWSAGTFGKGHSARWDDVFPVGFFGGREFKNPPRVVIRGDKVDGSCSFFFGMSGSPGISSIRTHTVWVDRDTCEQEMEILAKLK